MDSPQSLSLDRADFAREVAAHERPALLGFSAAWCTPCRPMAGVFTNLTRAFGKRVLISTVDIDVEPELAEQLGVGSVPTLIFFRAGKEIKRQLHHSNEAELEREIVQLLLS
ncbi:MAG: thioredoxin-like negative regulator of GroEL [Planctomycetota bacterium]|jgi:thioredoxin-like negative regulator of GroEL